MNNASGGLGMRQILNAFIVAIGLPLCWSMLAAMYDARDFDPLWLAADSVGYGAFVFPVTLAVAAALFFADEAIDRYQLSFSNELYGLLKDIGEHIKAGESVEASVYKASTWKKGSAPPSESSAAPTTLGTNVPQ